MKGSPFFWILMIVFVSFSCIRQPVSEKELNENWQFSQAGEKDSHKATVPGVVHTDLLVNKLIDDPFFSLNELELQWIGETDWEYKTTFFADEELLKNEHIEIVFTGLDTYAEVFLNGKPVLKADNMFRKWTVDCKGKLKTGNNELTVKFYSPLKVDSLKASKLPYSFPDSRAFTRKAPYQYGWDWGPRFITMGIWKPVYLRTWRDARIENIRIVQDSVTSDAAYYTSYFEIESSLEQDGFISVIDDDFNEIINKERVRFEKGTKEYPVTFYVDNPKLWWTNGLGKQNLYHFRFLMQANNSIDRKYKRIGVRTLKLVQQPDSIGESFYFQLNGVPVFIKGANYIPQDNFPSRVTARHYSKVIKSAVDANMNMLRVWGGGIYEKDLFYNLCDEKGILVWQDFMFACNMYPGDSAFLNNVEQEAEEQVKRIQYHPSLALWCGNNESDEGWHNWGWQKSLRYTKQDSVEVWSSYLNLFEKILPDVVQEYSPGIAYIPSSPRIGWGHKKAMYEGDMHYWGVWWGEEPFEIYEKKVGRFMSEYGFQGFPDVKTLRACLDSSDINLNSKALRNHNKHPRGMEIIDTYMKREYKTPDNFERYNYISQLIQAHGVTKAIEAHRRAKPYCMGTLYWQLNDCWPVISWSGVDYYNRWKALHYFVREAYKPLLISFEKENDSLHVFIVSDEQKEYQATLELKLEDFAGTKLWSKNIPVNIPKNSSKIYYEVKVSGLTKEMNRQNIVLSAKVILKELTLADKNFYFALPKDLELPSSLITKSIKRSPTGYQIIIATDKLAKNVFLSIDDEGFFSDNYFDILPGENKIIEFKTNKTIENFESRLKIMTLKEID